MNLALNKEEIFALSTTPKDNMITINKSSKKRSTDGKPKVPEEDINKHITFAAFDLSTKKFDSEIQPIASPQSYMRSNITLMTALYSKSF